MPKKHVYRIGDKVRIVTPSVFLRCGYPIDIAELAEKLSVEYGPDVQALVARMAGYVHDPAMPDMTSLIGSKVRGGMFLSNLFERFAYVVAKQQRFGGRDRTLHTVTKPEYIGRECSVVGKNTCKTGRHFGPSSYGPEDDYDYDPGGLEGEQTHVILALSSLDWLDAPVRIEARHVEPLVA